jgi:hypothetical protein
MKDVRVQFDIDTRPIDNMLAQELDGEVLGLKQEGVATPRSLGGDAGAEPLWAVHFARAHFQLGDLLFLSQPRTHLVADSRLTREVESVYPCQQHAGRHPRYGSHPSLSCVVHTCHHACHHSAPPPRGE